jgi:hypothetical protein
MAPINYMYIWPVEFLGSFAQSNNIFPYFKTLLFTFAKTCKTNATLVHPGASIPLFNPSNFIQKLEG